ncbi:MULTISPECIES: hypothetical protein [Roseateles]|uniref:Uncharacterized protein n=1 Tax=Pelomonas aquatica TaxID=431058 RepID=A0ABU1Z5T3_9BURK|nr:MULTISPECIES: hypothetical protein [Roseateles]MDR7295978.1 hypothetical protein [Pelomonas aquatica]
MPVITTVSSALGAEAAFDGGTAAACCAWTAAAPLSNAIEDAQATGLRRLVRRSRRILEI